ncbi:hypothetical protein [Anaerosporobacter sp.]
MNKLKKITFLGIAAVFLFSATACSKLTDSLDVVGNGSITSFEDILNTIPAYVQFDENNNGWKLTAPDETVGFVWSKDWSESSLYDTMLLIDAQPFIDAGLDVEKLPDNITYSENTLIVGTEFGNDKPTYSNEPTPLRSYEQIVDLKRDAIAYHMEMGHYGVNLGDGNMFEWAKDMSSNDKDIVFVLNPEPFINAGVDPNAIEGWVFGKVKVHVDGKQTEVDKLLKPFDLK